MIYFQGGKMSSSKSITNYFTAHRYYHMTDTPPQNLRFNYIVNLLDATFWGFGLGFASFTTILPLFVSQMTNSAILIGLIPAIHTMGWQLPQLFTASYLTKIKRFKPFVLLMTLIERTPFLGLAIIALFLPRIGVKFSIGLIFTLLIIQGFGGGLTANGWQNLICKVIPSEFRATFFGVQASVANLASGVGAIIAGVLLEKVAIPINFSLCFIIATILFSISFIFLSMNREQVRSIEPLVSRTIPVWEKSISILKNDKNFFWFIIYRTLAQFGFMSFAFYTVYAVEFHHASKTLVGIMTATFLITQVTANPFLGWLTDHWNRKKVLLIGAFTMLLSPLIAFFSPSSSLFFIVFIFAGIANTIFYTTSLGFIMDFGIEAERPTYIGLTNTISAPGTIFAQLLGGWIASLLGYPITFIFATISGFVSFVILFCFVNDPKKDKRILQNKLI